MDKQTKQFVKDCQAWIKKFNADMDDMQKKVDKSFDRLDTKLKVFESAVSNLLEE